MAENSIPLTKSNTDKWTMLGVLISIGIVFGDIGTSPLYTFTAIVRENIVTKDLVLGSVSAIFWTLVLQTTIKYVVITLRADNNGEGGIFSLYALIHRYAKWLFIPAIIGGSFILADGLITPPISVTSAIEGLLPLYPNLPVVPIVLAILILLFLSQRAGTSAIGNWFGPVMFVFFTMMGILGFAGLIKDPSVLKAMNPVYAFELITKYPKGFWLLGGVFLCTTGGEALYSDLGHCGRRNIQISWTYVKLTLILSYFGQAAWLMHHLGKPLGATNPFFELIPSWFYLTGTIISTFATIIASQALISGSFTLINEAIRLNLWPKMMVIFPSDEKGQIYLPAINYLLMAGCIGMVLYFKKSANMEAAFGLSVTVTMLMTTILLSFYLFIKKINKLVIAFFLLVYLTVEGSFLIANLKKFPNGGWVTFVIGLTLVSIMFIWRRAQLIKSRLTQFADLNELLPRLTLLSNDLSVPKYSTNLVYFTSSPNNNNIEIKIINSIFNYQPKRADNYWFVHIEVADTPHTIQYSVKTLKKDDVYWINIKLGFRDPPRLSKLIRKIITELVTSGEVDIKTEYSFLGDNSTTGDIRFVIINRFFSIENNLTAFPNFIMNAYFLLKKMSLPADKAYGLDFDEVTLEKAPLIVYSNQNLKIERVV